MSDDLLWLLFKALFATLVIEEIAACFFKERSWRFALVVLIMNVITNPTINIILQTVPDSWVETTDRYYALVLALELWVWGTEACFLRAFLKGCSWSRAFFLSFAINMTSFLSGVLLEPVGYWDW